MGSVTAMCMLGNGVCYSCVYHYEHLSVYINHQGPFLPHKQPQEARRGPRHAYKLLPPHTGCFVLFLLLVSHQNVFAIGWVEGISAHRHRPAGSLLYLIRCLKTLCLHEQSSSKTQAVY